MAHNHRKKAVADRQVQYTLARRVVLHFFVFVCAGAIFGIINQFMMDPFGGVAKNLNQFLRSSAPFLVALLCMLPMFVRDTLRLSNRVAGPVYNLRTTVKAIANGETNVRPLTFRKGDFWPELASDFNVMTERLRKEGAAQQLAATVAAEQADVSSSTDTSPVDC